MLKKEADGGFTAAAEAAGSGRPIGSAPGGLLCSDRENLEPEPFGSAV